MTQIYAIPKRKTTWSLRKQWGKRQRTKSNERTKKNEKHFWSKSANCIIFISIQGIIQHFIQKAIAITWIVALYNRRRRVARRVRKREREQFGVRRVHNSIRKRNSRHALMKLRKSGEKKTLKFSYPLCTVWRAVVLSQYCLPSLYSFRFPERLSSSSSSCENWLHWVPWTRNNSKAALQKPNNAHI